MAVVAASLVLAAQVPNCTRIVYVVDYTVHKDVNNIVDSPTAPHTDTRRVGSDNSGTACADLPAQTAHTDTAHIRTSDTTPALSASELAALRAYNPYTPPQANYASRSSYLQPFVTCRRQN